MLAVSKPSTFMRLGPTPTNTRKPPMQRTLIAAMIAFACAAPAASAIAAPQVLATTQLPRNARPVHYNVTITPDAWNLSFKGQVQIDFEVLAPTDTVTLQAADLAIASAFVHTPAGKELPAAVT